jgi:hypothetical protein
MQMKTREDKSCRFPSAARDYECCQSSKYGESNVVPEHVVVVRKPSQRMTALGCEELRQDASPVKVRSDACHCDQNSISSPVCKVRNHPSGKKVSDRTQSAPTTAKT